MKLFKNLSREIAKNCSDEEIKRARNLQRLLESVHGYRKRKISRRNVRGATEQRKLIEILFPRELFLDSPRTFRTCGYFFLSDGKWTTNGARSSNPIARTFRATNNYVREQDNGSKSGWTCLLPKTARLFYARHSASLRLRFSGLDVLARFISTLFPPVEEQLERDQVCFQFYSDLCENAPPCNIAISYQNFWTQRQRFGEKEYPNWSPES